MCHPLMLWNMNIFKFHNIHVILLSEHVHPFETFGIFHKSHAQQDVATEEEKFSHLSIFKKIFFYWQW